MAAGHRCRSTDADTAYLVAKEKELNAMLDKVARQNKATLVDGYQGGIGKDACKEPTVRWVEPQVAPVEAAPLHPNAAGMAGYAKAVEGAIPK